MTLTPMMQCDDLVASFNGVMERQNWKASLAGTIIKPAVRFNSTTSMMEVTYTQDGRLAVAFSKINCAFGDYMQAIYKALTGIALALKAAGYPMIAPLSEQDGVVRVEFDPITKQVYVMLAHLADQWNEKST